MANMFGTLYPMLFFFHLFMASLSMLDQDISDFQSYLFGFDERSEHIDLAQNEIILDIPGGAFSNYKSAKTINLSHNLISQVHVDAFEETPLEVLLLNSNELEYIPKFNISTLRVLEMTGNFLTALEPGNFDGTPNLERLALGDNTRFQICDNVEALDVLASTLVMLDLHRTNETGPCVLDLALFTKLETLHISYSDLSTVVLNSSTSVSETSTSAMTTLAMNGNELEDAYIININTFSSLTNFQFELNSLQYFPDFSVNLRGSLQQVHLYGNKIAALHRENLKGMLNLMTLDLASNSITEISGLPYLPKLERLYLDSNQLVSLPADMFYQLPALIYVDLLGNPWHCDCTFKMLMNVSKDRPDLDVRIKQAPCSTPTDLQRVLLDELTDMSDCPDAMKIYWLSNNSWTESASGCPCSFDEDRTDCACCSEGGCQCPTDAHYMCAQCGYLAQQCGPQAHGEKMTSWMFSSFQCEHQSAGNSAASIRCGIRCLETSCSSFDIKDTQCLFHSSSQEGKCRKVD